MTTPLPPVGTIALLKLLSGYVPDAFIADLCPRAFTGGRRHDLSAAQLWRTHLLAGLTSTRSLNLIVAQLPEQPAWRQFARLRRQFPTARMLSEFRQRVGVSGLRRINQHLLGRLLHRQGVQPHAVALMDATDLPASCGGFKKKFRHLHRRARRVGRTHSQDRTKPLLRRLQEAHVALVAAHAASVGDVVALGHLGDSGQCGRGRPAPARLAVVPFPSGLVAGHCGGGHGVSVGGKQSGGAHRLADGGGDEAALRHAAAATLPERGARRLSTGSTAGLVGIRSAERAAVVSRAGEPGVLSALLGSVRLSTPFRLRRWAARDAVRIDPTGQPGGGAFVAPSPTVDRTGTVL